MLALVDCNNFFASCEMVFNPKLENRAVGILSNNDGCIISRSKRAKEMGIKMGDPAYLYQGMKEITLLSSNFPLYADMSQRVMETLSSFSPHMEIYSIDEAFFPLPESENLYNEAITMRNRVNKWTGIPVSIGIGPTKTLAKLASKVAKTEGGVHILTSHNTPLLLEKTAPEDIWGIGKQLSSHLKKKGIYTALSLAKAEDSWIRKVLGVTGFRTVLELRGTPCLTIDEIPEKKKSIVCSRSFGSSTANLESLHEAAACFISNAAKKLRSQKSLTSFISVFAITKQETSSCHLHLTHPTSYTPELISVAKQGVSQIYQEGVLYQKLGVLLGQSSEEDAVQTDLITPSSTNNKKIKAMEILDQINTRFAKTSIRFAAEGREGSWKSKKDNMTPQFTTKWSDLLKVKAR